MMRLSCWLIGLTILSSTWLLHADDAAKTPSLGEVLAKARQTQGLSADGQGTLPPWSAQGQAKFRGVMAPYHLQVGPRGAFVEHVDHRLGYRTGFNGQVCWRAEYDDYARVLELLDRDLSLLVSWLHSQFWLHADAPLAMRLAPAQESSTTVDLLVDMKETKLKTKLTIDLATGLPKSLHYVAASGPISWTFHDYRPVGSLQIAHRIVENYGQLVQERTLERTTALDQPPSCDPPASKPRLIAFPEDQTAVVETRRTNSGHLLVKALVNGKDHGWFIFDSGAGAMLIDKTVAEELKMDAVGEILMVGLGGNQRSRFRVGESFQLGQALLKEPVYIELDMKPFGALMGAKIAGICGYPLLARALVEIEPANGKLSVHDPAKYELTGGSWQELILHRNLPTVKARFEGDREALFRLDTGAGVTVDFHTPAVREFDLLLNRKTTARLQGGVGGLVRMQQGTLAWFELGGRRFENPVVGFSQALQGAYTDEYVAGNIGTGFMKPFKVVFHYPEKKIAFLRLKDTLDDGD